MVERHVTGTSSAAVDADRRRCRACHSPRLDEIIFFKMVAIELEIYFRVQVCQLHSGGGNLLAY